MSAFSLIIARATARLERRERDRQAQERGDVVEFLRMSSTARIPEYATALAVGMDLCADDDYEIQIGDRALVRTGIGISLPPHLEAQVRPRSGLAVKQGVTVLNSPGTIDPDYRGEIGVILYNAGNETVGIRRGDRIAQLVIAPFVRASLREVGKLSTTARGAGGFGSTGVRG